MRTKFTAVRLLLLLMLLFTGLVAERALAQYGPPPPPPPRPEKADLAFKSVTFKPVGASTAAAQPTPIKVGDTLEFTAVVINKGIGAADAFSVELKDSAGAISQSVLGLAANEEKDLKFTRKLSKETETFIFTIDPDKKINDSDRNNNVFKLEVRAEAAPPEVQEYALIYSPNLSTCPSVLAVKPGKIRLLNTALSGSMSELTIREATTKQTLFGLQPFSVESGKLTTVEFVLDKPGEYEIVQGQTVVGKLTTQFKEEVFEVGLIYSAKELKTVPATEIGRASCRERV